MPAPRNALTIVELRRLLSQVGPDADTKPFAVLTKHGVFYLAPGMMVQSDRVLSESNPEEK